MNLYQDDLDSQNRERSTRTELKVMDLGKVTEPFPAVFCGFLRKSSVFWFPAPLKMLEFPREGKNLRKSAFWALSVTFVPSP